jgi:thioredoxin 1
MITRIHPARILSMVALALALGVGTAPAQQKEPFTEARFAALQEQGALIMLDVFADWCSTCALQQKVLAEYRAQHPGVPLHTLVIDFDTQKEYVKHFRAPRQSTLILYRGKERLWFGVAETRKDVIFTELNKAAAAPGR